MPKGLKAPEGPRGGRGRHGRSDVFTGSFNAPLSSCCLRNATGRRRPFGTSS